MEYGDYIKVMPIVEEGDDYETLSRKAEECKNLMKKHWDDFKNSSETNSVWLDRYSTQP